jgi:hypothetical protein
MGQLGRQFVSLETLPGGGGSCTPLCAALARLGVIREAIRQSKRSPPGDGGGYCTLSYCCSA